MNLKLLKTFIVCLFHVQMLSIVRTVILNKRGDCLTFHTVSGTTNRYCIQNKNKGKNKYQKRLCDIYHSEFSSNIMIKAICPRPSTVQYLHKLNLKYPVDETELRFESYICNTLVVIFLLLVAIYKLVSNFWYVQNKQEMSITSLVCVLRKSKHKMNIPAKYLAVNNASHDVI